MSVIVATRSRARRRSAPASDAVVIDSTGSRSSRRSTRCWRSGSSRQGPDAERGFGPQAGSRSVDQRGPGRLESPTSGSRSRPIGVHHARRKRARWRFATPRVQGDAWCEPYGNSMSTAVSESRRSQEESFAALFEESLTRQEMRQGEVITAEVVRVDHNYVVVNAGLKSESYVPVEEFYNDRGELEVEVGDFVSVAIDSLEDGFGETRLSRDRAKRLAAWVQLEQSLDAGDLVTGTVTGKVKGGLTVMTNGIRAFLPGSLIDTRPVKDTTPFEGKTLDFKVIKLDRRRNNVVLSRRAVIELSQGEERAKLLETLAEGADRQRRGQEHHRLRRVRGPRRHRRPAAHHRHGLAPRAPSVGGAAGRPGNHRQGAQVRPGEEPRLARHQATRRGSVGRHRPALPAGHAHVRQDHQHHRLRCVRGDRAGHRRPGARLGDGLDQQERQPRQGGRARRRGRGHGPGDRRGSPPDLARHEAVPGQSVAGVLARTIAATTRSSGSIKSITDFGVFIGLPGGIDGLVHLSDLSWHKTGEEAVRDFKKGDEVEAVVLGIDVERERISLGIKQLEGDPFTNFASAHDKGAIVSGTDHQRRCPRCHDPDRAGSRGLPARVGDLARPRRRCPHASRTEGSTIESMIINIDRKNRSIALSIKARETVDTAEAMQKMRRDVGCHRDDQSWCAAPGQAGQAGQRQQQQPITDRVHLREAAALRRPLRAPVRILSEDPQWQNRRTSTINQRRGR